MRASNPLRIAKRAEALRKKKALSLPAKAVFVPGAGVNLPNFLKEEKAKGLYAKVHVGYITLH